MILTTKHKWRDNPADWTTDYVPYPDGFGEREKEAYQTLINSITGLSRDKPILRLEWGGEEKVTRYDKWDSSGNPIHLIEEPKYKARRESRIIPGVYHFLPMRRWVIAQRQEPEQYGYGDDSDNTYTDEFGVTKKPAEKPTELYTPLIFIGDHSKCEKDCCATRLCPGDYKHPGIPELDWIREKTKLLYKEFKADPYSPLSPADISRIIRENQPKISLEEKIEDLAKSI